MDEFHQQVLIQLKRKKISLKHLTSHNLHPQHLTKMFNDINRTQFYSKL